jgi:hypothetical protein
MILGKDIRPAYATSVDFVLANGELSIALGDDDGVLRLLTYDPSGMLMIEYRPSSGPLTDSCTTRS